MTSCATFTDCAYVRFAAVSEGFAVIETLLNLPGLGDLHWLATDQIDDKFFWNA